MIPSDIRLFTWVDVEEVLLRKQQQGDWPNWLVWARTYWDGLTMGIRPGTQEQAKNWLSEIYDPRFRNHSPSDSLESHIILESISGNDRTLPILFEETLENPPNPRLTPSLSRPGVLWPPTENIEPPAIMPSDFPPVVAFHSFKGGVGRTTHAIALAKALTAKKQKVLLVDGDLEAPGISWLFDRIPAPVSFADLLALAHGDPSPDAETAIQLVADRLQDALIDGMFILPSFRSTSGFTSLEIRPEHLIQGSENPFLLTNILGSLGKALAVDVVLVDLRAGLSELATGLILDPRVYRIFVTTLSGQSISGTIKVLELIGERSLSTREEDPLPALILTQVPEEQKLTDLVIKPEKKLLEAAKPFLGEDRDILRAITPFADSLLVLPPTWEELMTKLMRSGLVDAVSPLLEWLPSQGCETIPENLPSSNLKQQREQLKDLAGRLVYAETAEIDNFLATIPLKRLASDGQRQLPITVVVGAKGSGKTYTFLQIVRRKNWEDFVRATGYAFESKALISPILYSKNLEYKAQKIVENVRIHTSQVLGLSQPQDSNSIRDKIREYLTNNLHEGQWRERWLDIMAWGIGFKPESEGAGRELTQYLFKKKQQLIVAIDGLEDLFQDFDNDPNQQTALRALLQEVPDWLGQQPARFLGILIFVRRDILLAAVRQNAAQMMARYQPYALKWNREEALRLVAWVTKQAIPNFNIDMKKLQDMSEHELTDRLVPLWGKRLGNAKSREAHSVRFAIAALSDFNGQIQSRDLVRLLNIAAEKSINDTKWQDRILVPKAIRDALPECSEQKIQEIEIENTAFKEIFTKLRELPEATRKIPFTRENTQLSTEEIKTLVNNGVVIREGDEYYMPEIFRLGLEFSLKNGVRPRVLYLARRAGQNA